MNNSRKFVIYHLPFILYAGAIITVSSLPHLKTPHLKFLAFDKLAHFCEYAIFAWLTFRSFSHLGSKVTVNHAVTLSALFVCVFAVFDELYQRYIPGRVCDYRDFLADMAAAILVLILVWLRFRRTQARVS